MAIDYDLVVIGRSPAGIAAATLAAQFQARVALVEQPGPGLTHQAQAIHGQVLRQASQQWQQQQLAAHIGCYGSSPQLYAWRFPLLYDGAQTALAPISGDEILNHLGTLGVDVIPGSGEFCRRPTLAFCTDQRRLRSRAYLLATGTTIERPIINSKRTTFGIPLGALWQRDRWAALPERLLIVGGNPLALELAQSLARFGKQVTLVVETQELLPNEDCEIGQLVQALLESDHVQIWTGQVIQQITALTHPQETLRIQTQGQVFTAEQMIWATAGIPHVAGLNLAGVGVSTHGGYIRVNRKLQTSHARIYACGEMLGGYPLPSIATAEARIAVKNALLWPRFNISYQEIPWAITMDPSLARVGYNVTQAKQQYGQQEIELVHQADIDLPPAAILSPSVRWCQLIVHRRGKILGANLIAPHAMESIGAIALAIRHGLKIDELANLPVPPFSSSHLIQQTAQTWQQQTLAHHHQWQQWLETGLIWRRDWSS